MILHGIYDNGKIMINEKCIPRIKTTVEIHIPDKVGSPSNEAIHKKGRNVRGVLSKYKDRELLEREQHAWEIGVREKYGNR